MGCSDEESVDNYTCMYIAALYFVLGWLYTEV